MVSLFEHSFCNTRAKYFWQNFCVIRDTKILYRKYSAERWRTSARINFKKNGRRLFFLFFFLWITDATVKNWAWPTSSIQLTHRCGTRFQRNLTGQIPGESSSTKMRAEGEKRGWKWEKNNNRGMREIFGIILGYFRQAVICLCTRNTWLRILVLRENALWQTWHSNCFSTPQSNFKCLYKEFFRWYTRPHLFGQGNDVPLVRPLAYLVNFCIRIRRSLSR